MRRLMVVAVISMLAAAGPVAAMPITDTEAQVLALINAQRQAGGCGPLVVNRQLQAAAEGHANAMAVKNFFSHVGKNGSKLKSRVRAEGYKGGTLGENIANGQKTPAAVVAAWMGSQGHRANIMKCRYQETGIALMYQADDEALPGDSYVPHYYWVQVFGKR